MLRASESHQKVDSLFVPAGTVENSPAIDRRETNEMASRPSGTLESLLAVISSVPAGRGFNCYFPGSELPGYFQIVPAGMKTLSITMYVSLLRNISYS